MKVNAHVGNLDERIEPRWAETEAMARGGMTAAVIATGHQIELFDGDERG